MTDQIKYTSPAEAALALQILIEEKFDRDQLTGWILITALGEARARAQETEDFVDGQISALLEVADERRSCIHYENRMRDTVRQLREMLAQQQEEAA